MKTVAVIAEYNPFHKGHRYHIEKSLEITGADYCIAVMSGDFVQRGECAVFDKYTRTKMALLNGADLVIELPAVFALSSAEGFASGAVTLINSLGIVDYLSFGSECGDINMIMNTAKLLLTENPALDKMIRNLLKKGYSYPRSLSEAVKHTEILLGASNVAASLNDTDRNLPYTSVFSSPNNILGIEYCKALLNTESNIKPLTIKREDNGYNNEEFDPNSQYISARALRSLIRENGDIDRFVCRNTFDPFSQKYVSNDNFSALLYYKLMSELNYGNADFTRYSDVNKELSGRIAETVKDYAGFDAFILKLKTKNLTYARISRCLYHILLGITDDLLTAPVDYIRILGFRKDAEGLLSTLKNNASLPLVTKLSDVKMTPLLKKDIYCANLYEQIAGRYINEMRRSPVIV